MGFENKIVPLSAIDLCDHTFRITTEEGIDALVESIKLMGLLHPPFLIKRGERFTVLSGFRRIQACYGLGWPSLSARVADSEMESVACIRIAIADNAQQRQLNLIEVSRALNLLSAFVPEPEKLVQTAASLALPGNLTVIKKIQKLCRLSPFIQELIVSGILSLSMALELEKIPPEAGRAFAEIFNELQLSLGKQREIFTLVNEIAIREEKNRLTILAEDDIRAIRSDENLTNAQKTSKIRFYLKQRRFPALAEAKIKYEAFQKKIPLGNNFRLIPPPDFEGSEFVIRLHFNTLDELKSHGSVLADLINNKHFSKILL